MEEQEAVLDVLATLAARSRVLATGRSSKTDPNNALSVAITALPNPTLRRVQAVGHSEVLRLLAKRNTNICHQLISVEGPMASGAMWVGSNPAGGTSEAADFGTSLSSW